MGFDFKEHEVIKGVYVITPHRFSDFRGDYIKVFEKNIYGENGITQLFNETSEIVSNRGVLRGLHFQTKDSQAKLVHVIKGKIFDVAVDLRKGSSTFGQFACFTLTPEDRKTIFIPEDFAHGFLTLEDDTIFTYQCSGSYRPEYCGGIMWNDREIGIDWPLDEEEIILSDKDKKNMSISNYRDKYIL